MMIPPVGETCYRDEWAIACGFGEWGASVDRLPSSNESLERVSGLVEWVTFLLFNVFGGHLLLEVQFSISYLKLDIIIKHLDGKLYRDVAKHEM